MIVRDKKVAVVGGGPGGLTLARLLQLKGAAVKVYERDTNRNVRVQGATLDLHYESGLKAIEAAGLMDAFKATYRPGNDRYRVTDEHAVIHYDEHEKESTGDFGDEWFRPEIDRGPLRDILLDSLQPDTVVWNSHIVSLERSGNGWNIIFKDGSTAYADIVVGADGANSKIRPVVTPIAPVYTGVTLLVGNIPDAEKNVPILNALVKGGKITALGKCRSLFLSEKGDGSLDVYIGWKAALDWASASGIDLTDNKQVLAWFKEEFAGWDELWLELFDCPEAEFTYRPLHGMPLGLHWETQPNITLLGDAAHVLPPNGEGVNTAMLDALNLTECLTNGKFTALKQAIAHYENQMFERFTEEAETTAAMMEWMYALNGLQVMIDMMSEMPG